MSDFDALEPDVYTRNVRRARKQHTCVECGGAIAPRTQYVEHWGIYDGDHRRYKQHLHCEDWYNTVNALCGGTLAFGSARVALSELDGHIPQNLLCVSCGYAAIDGCELVLKDGVLRRYHRTCLAIERRQCREKEDAGDSAL